MSKYGVSAFPPLSPDEKVLISLIAEHALNGTTQEEVNGLLNNDPKLINGYINYCKKQASQFKAKCEKTELQLELSNDRVKTLEEELDKIRKNNTPQPKST